MRFTSERLARAACDALKTALRLCSASRSVFQAEYASALTSGTATSVKPQAAGREKTAGTQPCPYNFNKILAVARTNVTHPGPRIYLVAASPPMAS